MKDIIFAMALRNVRINYLRSILAAIGITIGVIAIASMGMLGTNMTGSVKDQLSSMADKVSVTAFSGKGGGGGPPGAGSGSDNLTKSQYKSISKIADQYGYVYGLHSIRGKVQKGKDSWNTQVYGISQDAMRTVLNNLTTGGYPTSDPMILIGPSFASDNAFEAGSHFSISGKGVRVCGIIESRGMSMDMNTDNAVVMTEDLFTSLYGGKDEYSQVNIIVDDINSISSLKSDIESMLNRREEKVRVQDSSRMISSISSTLTTMTSFATLIASISLLVAAVSIFNIMMMSVTERIREIGILRSIGTQKEEILRMFLYEASLIGLLGVGIGLILSLVMGYVFIQIMVGSTKYFFTPESLIHLPYAMVIGLLICIVSGIYPAWRGANKDPITALRTE